MNPLSAAVTLPLILLTACTSGGETALPADTSAATAPASTGTTGTTDTTEASGSASIVTTVATSSVEPNADCTVSFQIEFDEGAPTDSFTIANSSTEAKIFSVQINLDTAAGNLVFDTESGGSGVEVFQPFVAGDGSANLSTAPNLADGASEILLDFSSFEPSDSFVFTTDIDDQLADSELGQIQVTGSELVGASALFEWAQPGVASPSTSAGVFGEMNTAVVSADCPDQ